MSEFAAMFLKSVWILELHIRNRLVSPLKSSLHNALTFLEATLLTKRLSGVCREVSHQIQGPPHHAIWCDANISPACSPPLRAN